MLRTNLFCTLWCVVLISSVNIASAQVELLGVGSLSGTSSDKSGLDDPNHEGLARLGGFSAVEHVEGNRFIALSDRGPLDGAIDFQCRYHTVTIDLNSDADSSSSVQVALVNTDKLVDNRGKHFTGLSTAFGSTDKHAGRLDPEGIRVLPGGGFVVSDEYGPAVIAFDANGRETSRFAVPDCFLAEHPAGTKAEENGLNSSGRASNNGMEGLARTPQGKLWGLMQRPLIQDSVRNETGKFDGVNCRLIELGTDQQRQFVYQLESNSNKLNEILAVSETQFLVIERDGEAGELAAFKKVMLIDIEGATDVSNLNTLPGELPKDVKPVAKRELIDFLDPKYGLAGEKMPEKIEGLAFGSQLPDGRRMLVVASDNDFVESNDSLFYVFAVGLDRRLTKN